MQELALEGGYLSVRIRWARPTSSRVSTHHLTVNPFSSGDLPDSAPFPTLCRRQLLPFFQLSAQVIPVLILALVFQARALESGRSKGFYAFYLQIWGWLFLGAGEAVALGVVFSGSQFRNAAGVVAGAVATGLTSLALQALARWGISNER
jgi:hypothetical protein